MKQEEKHTDCVSLRAVSDYQKNGLLGRFVVRRFLWKLTTNLSLIYVKLTIKFSSLSALPFRKNILFQINNRLTINSIYKTQILVIAQIFKSSTRVRRLKMLSYTIHLATGYFQQRFHSNRHYSCNITKYY